MIIEPERDQFFTQSEGKTEASTFDCVAEGNPIPLVQWYKIKKDKREVDLSIGNDKPYRLIISGKELEGGRNVYVCVAENRQATVNRTVNIVVTTGTIETDVIDQTNKQIDNQETLDSDQAINLANLVDSVIRQVKYDVVAKLNTTITNGSNKSDDSVAITSASKLFHNVIGRWDGVVRSENKTDNKSDTNQDQTLFNTNTGLIQSSQNLQNGTTNLQKVSLEYFKLNFLSSFHLNSINFIFKDVSHYS